MIMATIALLSRYGSKLAYGTGIRVNCTCFFSGKFLPWSVFWFVLRVVFGIGCAAGDFVADLGVAFVDDWVFLADKVVGNEKG